jgi:hypothetical protein
MAAFRRKADTQIRILDFPELTSAYEGEADAELRCIECFQQTASGPIADIHNSRKQAKRNPPKRVINIDLM